MIYSLCFWFCINLLQKQLDSPFWKPGVCNEKQLVHYIQLQKLSDFQLDLIPKLSHNKPIYAFSIPRFYVRCLDPSGQMSSAIRTSVATSSRNKSGLLWWLIVVKGQVCCYIVATDRQARQADILDLEVAFFLPHEAVRLTYW